MNHDEFLQTIKQHALPVILLEGTRTLRDDHAPLLEALAQRLASQFPSAIFRSGNAPGSDEAWARGVAQVDATRLELVVPYATHRKKYRAADARVLALEEAADAEIIVRETLLASPQYEALSRRRDAASQAKFSYLLRDTLKVLGAPELGFAPVSLALFYVTDLQKGGTAHTIRACQKQNVAFATQDDWMTWDF